jgi:hypothetical protein
VAEHERLWGTGGLITDPEHLSAASMLREHFRTRPPTTSDLDVEVQIADLSAYDAAFGTGEEVA